MHVADKQWEELAIDHETKYLRADVCLGSPESFSLEEKAAICEDMDATNKAIDYLHALFSVIAGQCAGVIPHLYAPVSTKVRDAF